MRKKSSHERRRYIRLNSVFPVEIFIPKTSDDKNPQLIQGFTHDISLGGLCVTVNNPDPSLISTIKDGKTTFDVHINMPVTRHPVEANARVAWHEVIDSRRHKQLRIGLSYEKIASPDKKRIINAARRIKWLPRIATIFIIALISILGFSRYYNMVLREENRTLIEDFYKVQEESSLYGRSISEIDKKYESLKSELAQKEGLEKKILEEQLKDIISRKKKAARLLEEAKYRRRELEEATVKNMYWWLKTHQNRFSGLIMSFEGDPSIKDWAFTYDQSLSCQVFLIFDDFERTEKILSFFKNKAKKKQGGFYNAYYVVSGNPAEHVVNVGPNIWIGIAACQYAEKTGDKSYLGMAEDIARWTIHQKDKDGGIRGGPGISWYSTEHNLDAYALFSMLNDITGKKIYKQEGENTLEWIRDHTYSARTQGMKRGKGDATIATDTLAWAIATIGPARLLKEGMDPYGIMKFAEDNCVVTTDFQRPDGSVVRITGFDFGKSRNIARGGIVSSEWTAQMIMAFRIMADFYSQLGEPQKAKEFGKKAEFYLSELDKMVISSPSRSGQGAGCLPYASQPNVDTGHGWRTPGGKQTGSVAGTAYTIFAKKDYNPLSLD